MSSSTIQIWANENRVSRIRQMAEQGMACRQIGEEIGQTTKWVHGFLIRQGIPFRREVNHGAKREFKKNPSLPAALWTDPEDDSVVYSDQVTRSIAHAQDVAQAIRENGYRTWASVSPTVLRAEGR